ncbi:MAG TPA: nucleotide exchange factor GrpE [Casimicrobiaceae bacterium]|nr:nucleotide exchange factor GrpE [Casimicrobiaceae bacterium]
MQDQTATPRPTDDKVHGDKLENAVMGEDDQALGDEPLTALDTASPLEKAQAEVAELKDAFLRARAETENVRRQSAQDVSKAHKFAVERFAEDLLAVKDALEQALSVDNATPEQLRAGVELTLRQIENAFGRAQLTVIDPVGEKFDPHRHQAMTLVESDQAPNTVVDVMQKGYALHDRVLRPALVTVAKS